MQQCHAALVVHGGVLLCGIQGSPVTSDCRGSDIEVSKEQLRADLLHARLKVQPVQEHCGLVTSCTHVITDASYPATLLLSFVHFSGMAEMVKLLLVQVFIHRLRKYIGAYLLQLGNVDAIVW